MIEYRGWRVTQSDGHYFAKQAGVGMNTNSLKGIKRMIDQKIEIRRMEKSK